MPNDKEFDEADFGDDVPMMEEETKENKTSNLFDDDEEEGSKQEVNELSTFEKNQLKIQKQIAELEAENMAEKEWTMKGEVNSKVRPMNSLLEEDLDVDIAVKPVPIITEETTKTLTDMIIQRIKDKAFDDVERKAPPKDSVYDPNRRWELEDEKSKKSLAEVYEEEYQKKMKKDEFKSEKALAVEKEHNEIDQIFKSICQDLDALSNWHYTPEAATMELQVVPNASVPAIAMEEIIPAHVSDAKVAAPKEVYDGKVQKSQAELDSAEKKRLRRKAKRKAASEKDAREKAKKLRGQQSETQGQITKKTALKKLMAQNNVTLVVDGRNKKELSKGSAKTIESGGKIGKEKQTFRPEKLKL
jgi:U3 small nucleolar RNA-associated protein MPP10